MKQESFTTIMLEAEEGKFLTQAANKITIPDRIIATKIALDVNDSPENWKEITAEEAEEIEKLKQEYYDNLDDL